MTTICAEGLGHRELNEAIRGACGPCSVESCRGQRFIAAGMSDVDLTVRGVPGNALGAYLNGGTVAVLGNAISATLRAMPCAAGKYTSEAAPATAPAYI